MKRANETDKRVDPRGIKNTDRLPAAVFLTPTVRLVLLCVMSASFILMFYEFYELPGNKWEWAGLAAAASGLVYTLASVLPSVLVYGSIVAAGGVVGWLLREKIWSYLQYFWDYMMLKLDSRLIDTSRSFIHNAAKIKAGLAYETAQMDKSVLIVTIMLIVLAAVVFTASVRTRFHLSPPVIAATLIVAPVIASERAGYVPSFFVYAACLFGLVMTTSSFELELGFVSGHLPSARLKEHRSDLTYYHRTRFLSFGKKLRSDTDRFHRHAGNCIAVTIVAGLVFYGATAVVPDGKGLKYQEVLSAFEDIGYRIADTVSGLFGTTFGAADDRGYFSEGGYNDNVNSISISPPSNSDRAVLEVTLSRNDIPVYLRGDIGTYYHSNNWNGVKTANDSYLKAVPEGFYPETEYQMFRKYLALVYSDPGLSDRVMPLQMVSLRYLRNTRVIFQPLAAYELNYRSNAKYECFSDFILRARSGFVKNYNTLALTPNFELYKPVGSGPDIEEFCENAHEYCDGVISSGYISAPEGMTTEEYVDAITGYRRYINDTFLDTSPTVRKFAEHFDYTENMFADDYELGGLFRYAFATELCDYFAKNFTYSLDAENGYDQLNGFLYDTHSGHCALFATAMTLTLREFGIPARYVTGYVVEGEGEQVKDGYRYTLTERQLHAWTEVYFNGIGWIAFDPTAKVPGYAEVLSGEWDGTSPHDYGTATKPADTEPPETMTTEPTTSPDITEPAATTPADSSADTTREPDELPGGDGDGGNGGIGGGTSPQAHEDLFAALLPFIVAAALAAAVIIIIVMFVRSVNRAEKKVFRGFRELPPTEASELMYRFVMLLLEKKQLVPGFEQFYDFAERVDGSIELKGANVFMMDVMPVFEKCEFGNADISPVDEDERAAVYRFTTAVYGKIMGDYSSLKRFFVKTSLFL